MVRKIPIISVLKNYRHWTRTNTIITDLLLELAGIVYDISSILGLIK